MSEKDIFIPYRHCNVIFLEDRAQNFFDSIKIELDRLNADLATIESRYKARESQIQDLDPQDIRRYQLYARQWADGRTFEDLIDEITSLENRIGAGNRISRLGP